MDMHSNRREYDKEMTNWTRDEKMLLDGLLTESLLEDFQVSIPDDFADRIMELVEKRKSIREALLKHLIMSLGFLVIFGFALLFLFYFKTNEADVLVQFALQFKYPIAFVFLIITAIQLADSFLVSRIKDLLNK